MKNIEKLAVFLIIAWVLQLISSPVYILSIMNVVQGDQLDTFGKAFGYLSGIGHGLVSLVCGVWLYLEGGKENQSKWVWCLFGLLFQLQAIAIFYLYVILQEMRVKKAAKASQAIGSEASPQSGR